MLIMKKILAFTAALLLSGSALAATTVTAPYVVRIERDTPQANIDNAAATGSEIVRKSFKTSTSEGNGFNWGGYNAAANAVAINGSQLQFNNAACRATSYAYTRFDNSPNAELVTDTTNYNNSSVIVDAGAAGASIVVNFHYAQIAGSAALLLRDDTTWYQSSSVNLAQSPTTPQDGIFNLDGASAATWQAVDLNVGGGLTLDLVKSGDEGPLTLLAGSATPNFASIQGIGVIVTAPEINTTGGFGFERITFDVPTAPDAPANLVATTVAGTVEVALDWDDVADATGYNVYRSETTGSGYTLVNTGGALTESQYTDTTVVDNTTYFYVVTALNAVGESANSNEQEATPTSTPAAVRDWMGY